MKTHSTYPTSNPRTSLLPKTPFSELVPYVRFYPTGILLGGFFSLKQNPLYVAAVVVGDLGLPRRPCLLFCWHLFWQLVVPPRKISHLLSFLKPVVPLGRQSCDWISFGSPMLSSSVSFVALDRICSSWSFRQLLMDAYISRVILSLETLRGGCMGLLRNPVRGCRWTSVEPIRVVLWKFCRIAAWVPSLDRTMTGCRAGVSTYWV